MHYRGQRRQVFTNQIQKHAPQFDRVISIEPSVTLFELHENKYKFPDQISFHLLDLFNMTANTFGLFDTALFVHVLEHIEHDREALNKVHELLLPNGKVLIEVPALPSLFSIHDEMLLSIQIRMSGPKADSKSIFRVFTGHYLFKIQ